jgi:hypothetical protein
VRSGRTDLKYRTAAARGGTIGRSVFAWAIGMLLGPRAAGIAQRRQQCAVYCRFGSGSKCTALSEVPGHDQPHQHHADSEAFVKDTAGKSLQWIADCLQSLCLAPAFEANDKMPCVFGKHPRAGPAATQ